MNTGLTSTSRSKIGINLDATKTMRTEPKPTVHTITTEFEDNNNQMIPLEIEYHRIGAWGHHEICEVNIKIDEYLCDKSDLEWEARRLIREDVKKRFAYYAEFDDISFA